MRVRAWEWVDSLSWSDLGELGDQLVLGTFDWTDWFDRRPEPGFLAEADERRIQREIVG
jgi:hypothetical protein